MFWESGDNAWRLRAKASVAHRAEYELARWHVAQQVKPAYWTARGSQEIRTVLQTTVDNFQKVIDYHSAQLSAGAIAEQDLLRVRLEGERLKISADLALIDVNRARMELLKEMGETQFSERCPYGTAGGRRLRSRRWEWSRRWRNEWKSKLRGRRWNRPRQMLKFQDVSARPDLNVTYGYKRTQLPDASDGVNTAIVSVRVTLPTTDKNQGNRIAAEAEVRRQQQLLAAMETEIRADYEGALQEYETRRTEFVQRACNRCASMQRTFRRLPRRPTQRVAPICSVCWTPKERTWMRSLHGRAEWWSTGRASSNWKRLKESFNEAL